MKDFVKSNLIVTRFFIRDNKLLIIYITLFTIGTAVGSLSLGLLGEKSTTLIKLLKLFFAENSSLSIITLFSRNLISSFIYLGVMYVAGLCAIGLPIIGIIPVIKGISTGIIVSYQYALSGIKGFLYILAIVLIPSAFSVTIFNYAYIEGIHMSLTVSNGIYNGKPRNLEIECNFLTFTKRFLLFAIFIVILSIIEAVMTNVFSSVL